MTFDEFWKAFLAEVDRETFSERELAKGHHSQAFLGSVEWHKELAKRAWKKLQEETK